MSEVDDKNIRFASPRFLSVLPEHSEDAKNPNEITIRGRQKNSNKENTVDLFYNLIKIKRKLRFNFLIALL